jgi:hypothetical protein
MEIDMKEILNKILSMGKARNTSGTVIFMKELTPMGNQKEKDFISGVVGAIMKV